MCIKWSSDKLAIYWWVHQGQRLSWALVKPLWCNNHTASCHAPYPNLYNIIWPCHTIYTILLYTAVLLRPRPLHCLYHHPGTFSSPAINMNSPFPFQLLVSSPAHLRCSRTFCLSKHALAGITITSAATYCSWRADEQEGFVLRIGHYQLDLTEGSRSKGKHTSFSEMTNDKLLFAIV